jgi:uncharacterized protein YecT (DUF1311 family)
LRNFYLAVPIASCLLLTGHARATESCEFDGDQQTVNACADKHYQAADRALNDVWQKLMSVTKDEDNADMNQRLRTAQKFWIAYRDNMCAIYYKAGDMGSVLPMLYSLCLTRLTTEQTKRLKDLCEDGAINCQQ